MKIISTGNFFGNKRKYEELKGLTKQIKPDILLLTGDLFFDDHYSPLLQSEYLFECKEYFIEYSKNCDKLLYIFGETDLKCLDETFYSMLKSESESIVCLNQENFNYNEHTFIGLPFVTNSKTPLKDWVRQDSLALNESEVDGFYTTDDFDINHIYSKEDMYEFLNDKQNIQDILNKKLENSLKYKVLVSHFPFYDGISKKYTFCLESFIDIFDVVYTGDGELNESYNIYLKNNCNIVNHGKEKNFLLYNINIINKGNLIYNHHPLNTIEDVFNNAKIYRDINYAN